MQRVVGLVGKHLMVLLVERVESVAQLGHRQQVHQGLMDLVGEVVAAPTIRTMHRSRVVLVDLAMSSMLHMVLEVEGVEEVVETRLPAQTGMEALAVFMGVEEVEGGRMFLELVGLVLEVMVRRVSWSSLILLLEVVEAVEVVVVGTPSCLTQRQLLSLIS